MGTSGVIALIRRELQTFVDGMFTAKPETVPTGYNPLEVIRNGLYHWVAVPFNGVNVFCQLRCPNAVQVKECGDISNIIISYKENEYTYEDMIKVKNYQEALCEIVFNKPTFAEIGVLIGETDFVLKNYRNELKEIENKLNNNADKLSETVKMELQARLNILDIKTGFILPDDTMNFITHWAMGNDISDIKRITKDTFLQAGALGAMYHKPPSDFISGVFTDYNKTEIDSYATKVFNDYQEEHKIVSGSKYNWILGKNKKPIKDSVPTK